MGECSVKVINEDLTGHPHCSHGPTLLFENINSTSKFYACSALRGKNECKVFVNKDSKKDNVSSHANLPVNKLVEIKKAPHANRVYCHNCGTLSLVEAMNVKKHENHKLHIGIDDDLLKKPTILMNPLSNDKKEAQYFFSQPTLNCIASIFQQLNFGKIVCIGAPRLHEFLKNNFRQLKIHSILLDIDVRFRQFYNTNEFYHYNMFNNYFFDGLGCKDNFEKFLKLDDENRKICLFTDPPFGCRTEPLSYTIKLLSKRYQELNSFREVLSVMWIFPYFMETYIKDVMPEMEMIDYKINYTNHELYHDGKKGRKEGSPVRIFSNILSNLIKLPTSEGYWYCQKCQRWSSRENKHCFKCEKCPSKNGSTYVHCELCAICVKPNYKHCTQCNRCTQIAEHKCEEYVKNLRCWICKIRGHNETNCNLWFNRNKKINKNVLQKKSCKIGKKICCICQSKGHNEMQCGTRTKLLNEKYFLNKCYQCQFCGQQFELSSLLLCHSLEFHRSGPDRQKISTIINSFLQNQEETIYSSDSDCDYQIVTTIRRVAKVKPENSIESDDEPIIKLAQHRLSLKTSDKFVDAIKQEEQEDTGIINDVFIATGNYLEQEPFDYKHPCDFCERKFLTKLAVNKHCKNEHRSIVDIKADDSDDNHFNGREDSYESESKENILTKKPNKKLGAKNSFTCDCCQKKFSTFRKIQIHIKKNHAVINDVDSGNSLDESENADESVNFSTEFEMQSDEDFRRTRKNTGYSCPICSNIFSSKGTLSKHFLKLHKKDGLSLTDNLSLLKQNRGIGFSCALCPKTYDCRTALYRHLLVKHKLNKKDRVVTAKTWTCEICKKSFFRVKCFVKHKALHSNQLEKVPKKRLLKRDKKFLCSFCGKKYQTSNHLKIHLRIHTGERPYTCSFCAKNFTIKKTWQDHENSHTGEKPYGCPIDTCGKFFTHASGVRQHMLSVHTPEKRFQCEHCDKRFSKKTHLLDHIRSHTGERPFECKYCGIKFRLTSTLRIHNRTHTGERPFKCEICNKGFIKSYGLKQHLRSKRNCTPQQQPPQNIQLEQQPAMISQQLPPLVPITINNSTAIGHNVQNSNPNNSIIITNPENSMVISIMHQLQ